jgi:hypothetical protein
MLSNVMHMAHLHPFTANQHMPLKEMFNHAQRLAANTSTLLQNQYTHRSTSVFNSLTL